MPQEDIAKLGGAVLACVLVVGSVMLYATNRKAVVEGVGGVLQSSPLALPLYGEGTATGAPELAPVTEPTLADYRISYLCGYKSGQPFEANAEMIVQARTDREAGSQFYQRRKGQPGGCHVVTITRLE
jgi:hypothetical protein